MPKSRYGYKHKLERRKWQAIVNAGQAHCCLCGRWLPPGSPFDLDHMPGTDTYRGVACPSCNRADGGRRRHAARAPRRWVL